MARSQLANLGWMLFSITIPDQKAISDFDPPLIPLLIPKAIVFWQAAQRTRVVIDAHHAASVLRGHVARYTLFGQFFPIWELHSSWAPRMGNHVLCTRLRTPSHMH